jgi:hypothetical protein
MLKVLPLLRRHTVAFLALFLLLGSTAYAVADRVAGPTPKRVYACVTSTYGTLNLSNATRACPNGQKKISWDANGKRGARGPAGPAGNNGAAGATGPTGATGAKGGDGAPGVKGDTGVAGPPGAAGATGDIGPQGDPGPAGPGGPVEFAEFFALMPPDNAATVAAGSAVEFPQNGPTNGAIVRIDAGTFVLPGVATYRVAFSVPVTEAGQLQLELDGTPLAYTVHGRATGTTEIAGEALVTTSAANSLVSVINPGSNATALTITPLAGGTAPAAASVIIERLD